MVSSPPPSRWVLHTKLSVVSIRQNKHGPQSKVCTMLRYMICKIIRRCLRVSCHDQRLVLQASLWMARLKQDLLSYSFHGVPQDWEDGVLLTAQSWVMQPEISVKVMHLTSSDQMIQMEDHISREIAITTGMEATRPNIQGTLTNVMDCFFAHQWKNPNNQNRQWLRDIGIYWNARFTIVLWCSMVILLYPGHIQQSRVDGRWPGYSFADLVALSGVTWDDQGPAVWFRSNKNSIMVKAV